MVTQIINTQTPGIPRAIEIERSQFLSQVVPAGEIVRLTVSQNPPNGPGVIFLNGQFIQAKMPPELQAGDRILATLSASQDAVLFKILDLMKAPQEPTVLPYTLRLREQLMTLLQEKSGSELRAGPPLPLPASSQELDSLLAKLGFRLPNIMPETVEQNIKENSSKLSLSSQLKSEGNTAELPQSSTLKSEGAVNQNSLSTSLKSSSSFPELPLSSVLKNLQDLANPREVLSQLLAAARGDLALPLKDSAILLRNFFSNLFPQSQNQLLYSLQEKLLNLLEQGGNDNLFVARNLSSLIDTLSKSTSQLSLGSETERTLIREVLKDLLRAQQQPAQAKSELQLAAQRLATELPAAAKDSHSTERLLEPIIQQLATRLDQLAATQETLRQLNPIMQALGEPAFILLPFIFQGLLTHSEISIERKEPLPKKNSKKEQSNSEDKSGGEVSLDPWQRVQVSVPLPAMGLIHVDVAHRKNELLARFTTEDANVAAFLHEQLEHLAIILRELGYDQAQLIAAVGESPESAPAWIEGLTARGSIIA